VKECVPPPAAKQARALQFTITGVMSSWAFQCPFPSGAELDSCSMALRRSSTP
jgi:hypothetical protein